MAWCSASARPRPGSASAAERGDVALIKALSVAPAKAGAHNHRGRLPAKIASAQSIQSIGRGLWVPAIRRDDTGDLAPLLSIPRTLAAIDRHSRVASARR